MPEYIPYLTTEPTHSKFDSPDFYCCPEDDDGVVDLVDLFNDEAE